ncbi:MAG TPA: aldo/keto reductase [Chthonomonadaceae bacterium]|nr:aldo/keto reductase [Chthonomonadaceae bacterium]
MPRTMSFQALGTHGFEVSRIALGCMGLAGTWNPAEVGPENRRKAIASVEAALEAGINFFDHADIYGGTACESIFKDCMEALRPGRESIFIATKVGIRSGYYDHSPEHIRSSVEASLKRLGIEYIDLYQLHRPDPLSHPAETAQALEDLIAEGKIRDVGVSNYYPNQCNALASYLDPDIVTNQFEFSLLHLEPLYEGREGQGGDGVLDHCLENQITPLAYSPVGRGWLSGRRHIPPDHPHRERFERVLAALRELGDAYGGATPVQLAVAWLLRHPAGIIPLVGSNSPQHIREAAEAHAIELSRTDWYKLWVASRGARVP